MPNTTISGLADELDAPNVDVSADWMEIDDVSAGVTKKVHPDSLVDAYVDGRTELAETPATGDFFVVVDVSDGTVKRVDMTNLAAGVLAAVPDGSEAAPAIAFASDPNTGVYLNGGDKLAISVGGTKRVQIEASVLSITPPINGPDGTAALPAYAFTNNPNSGVFAPDTATIGLSAVGVVRATVSPDGLSVVSGQLQILNGSVGAPGLRIGAAADTGMYGVDADTIAITASGVEVARATAPAGADPQLQVANGDAGDPALSFAADDDTGIYRPGANQIGLSTAGVLRATIDSAGLLVATGVISAPAGSVGTPSINVSQADTGLYDGGADTLAISAGGVQVASFQAPGGASPQLLVPTGSTPGIAGIGDADTGLVWPSANVLGVKTGGTQILQFGTTTGLSMGVGTPALPGVNSVFDLDTGILWPGADVFAVASGGKTAWTVKRSSDVPETAAITVESDYVRTTDATVTTLWSKTLAASTVYRVTARIVARNEAGTGRAYYVREALVYREGAGAVLEGAVATTVTVESDGAWDATIDVNSNDVRVRVTGAAANISWAATVEVQAISTSA